MHESGHGAQGLAASEDEGGAGPAQGLPITGVLEWTAVRSDTTQCVALKTYREDTMTVSGTSCGLCVLVMNHSPTESQGSEVALQVGSAEFQGSLGGGGASDEVPNMSTRSSMADYRGDRKLFCKYVPNILGLATNTHVKGCVWTHCSVCLFWAMVETLWCHMSNFTDSPSVDM